MQSTTVFEPHGFIRLVDWVGDELAIVNAARVSFHKESEYEVDGALKEPDQKLIQYLLRNEHGTPFEQGFMSQWHIRVPLMVAREWFRHRIGVSYNEESGRYTELRKDFFYPEEIRTQVGKPGNYTFEPLNDKGREGWIQGLIKMHSERSFDLYRQLLDMDVAKEQARMVLPLNLYTEFRWTCNARSLMNFLALRNSPHAMKEIRECAHAIEQVFAEKMPVTYAAFMDNERVAP